MAVDSYMTLSQLQERIRETLCRGFAAPVWITAEIGELKVKNWVWNQVLSLQGKWLQHCAI